MTGSLLVESSGANWVLAFIYQGPEARWGAMHLYSGATTDFVADATRNRISEKLASAFFDHFRYQPAQSEVRSWQNSLRAMAQVVQLASLEDHGVIVELQLPLSSRRLDCLFTGRDGRDADQSVIIELKQWEEVAPSNIDDCVTVFLGARLRDVLHPSRQVGNYKRYLQDVHTSFSEESIQLEACSYLHNMTFNPASPMFDTRFGTLLQQFPAYTGDRADDLASFLDHQLSGGDGLAALDRVLKGRYRPHKRLLDHTARVIRREPAFVLLDEQQVAFNDIMGNIHRRQRSTDQTVFLIRGGPGTGKSLIAVNLLADLSSGRRLPRTSEGWSVPGQPCNSAISMDSRTRSRASWMHSSATKRIGSGRPAIPDSHPRPHGRTCHRSKS